MGAKQSTLGIILQKLDTKGKMLWSQKEPFSTEERGGIITNYPHINRLTVVEYPDAKQNLVVSYDFVGAMGMTGVKNKRTIAMAFDPATGRKTETQIKDSEEINNVTKDKKKYTTNLPRM